MKSKPARGRPAKAGDNSTFAGTFAATLRRLRTRRGLSVADLAAKLGVSAATIYDWEDAARAKPGTQSLPAIARALGCRPRDLLP